MTKGKYDLYFNERDDLDDIRRRLIDLKVSTINDGLWEITSKRPSVDNHMWFIRRDRRQKNPYGLNLGIPMIWFPDLWDAAYRADEVLHAPDIVECDELARLIEQVWAHNLG